jgi:hypothetical protein
MFKLLFRALTALGIATRRSVNASSARPTRGEGVRLGLTTVATWLQKAAAHGDAEARRELEQIKPAAIRIPGARGAWAVRSAAQRKYPLARVGISL